MLSAGYISLALDERVAEDGSDLPPLVHGSEVAKHIHNETGQSGTKITGEEKVHALISRT
jgi:hypothetical protein